MKTAISIPDELFENAERVANEKGMTRSQFYREAIEVHIKALESESITDKLNHVYAEDDCIIDEAFVEAQEAILADEEW